MIETVTQDKFVVDSNGNKTAVLLEMERYLELLEAKEDLEEIRLFDAAKLESDEVISFESTVAEIEATRK